MLNRGCLGQLRISSNECTRYMTISKEPRPGGFCTGASDEGGAEKADEGGEVEDDDGASDSTSLITGT